MSQFVKVMSKLPGLLPFRRFISPESSDHRLLEMAAANAVTPANITIGNYLHYKNVELDLDSFIACLHASDTYYNGVEGRKGYIDSSIPRLYRVFVNMLLMQENQKFQGPTLDVASGWGIMYPLYKKYLSNILPYYIAELTGWCTEVDGDKIEGCRFECEKDRLTYADNTFGLVCFFDCLEHLLVDPIWPLLEFNRVLKIGGRLIISTPNALATFRIFRIFRGENPATTSEIKPTAIYERHNREWTPGEIQQALLCCGFGNIYYATNDYLLNEGEHQLLTFADKMGALTRPFHDFGPEIFMVAEKLEHRTLDDNLSPDLRWPTWLYTSYYGYRKRPKEYPIIVTGDSI